MYFEQFLEENLDLRTFVAFLMMVNLLVLGGNWGETVLVERFGTFRDYVWEHFKDIGSLVFYCSPFNTFCGQYKLSRLLNNGQYKTLTSFICYILLLQNKQFQNKSQKFVSPTYKQIFLPNLGRFKFQIWFISR